MDMEKQDWFDMDDGEIKIDELELQKFEKYVDEVAEQALKVKEIKGYLEEANGTLTKMKNRLMYMLEKMGKTSYKGNSATLSLKNKFSVKVPKDEEEKMKLFKWLKEKQISMQYLTVNSASLNSLYNSFLESEGAGFELPGVEQPKSYATLSVTVKKK